MFPGALPIHRSGETRHPCSRAAHLRSQCAQCARGSARRGVTAGNGDSDTGVSCQRCRRRRPQRRELRSDAGSEGRRGGGRSGVTPGSRGLSGTLRVPAAGQPVSGGAAVLGKRPAPSGGQDRRSRRLGGRWERSVRPGAAEHPSRAASAPARGRSRRQRGHVLPV